MLKSLLKALTPTQRDTMARMPRERLLNTVAAHRESHRVCHHTLNPDFLAAVRKPPAKRTLEAPWRQVAHEALARLGTLFEELRTSDLFRVTATAAAVASRADVEGAVVSDAMREVSTGPDYKPSCAVFDSQRHIPLLEK